MKHHQDAINTPGLFGKSYDTLKRSRGSAKRWQGNNLLL